MTTGDTSAYAVSCDALCSTLSYRHVHESCAFSDLPCSPPFGSVAVTQHLSSCTLRQSAAKEEVGRVRTTTRTDEVAGMGDKF